MDIMEIEIDDIMIHIQDIVVMIIKIITDIMEEDGDLDEITRCVYSLYSVFVRY